MLVPEMQQAMKWSSRAWSCIRHKRDMSSNIPGMRRKTREKDFERIVDAEKPYVKVMALKSLLAKEPENVLSFKELGRLRSHVGLSSKTRFITLISKYPAIFAVFKDESGDLWCGFSPQAQILVDQQRALADSYEMLAVQKLCKLLMMSVEHRIRVPKIAQLRRDFGFPADFHSRVIYAYPQYFKVVEEKYKNQDGPVLELNCWDPSLAVSSMEKRAKAMGGYNSSGEPLFKMSMPRAFRLSIKQKEGIEKFQERVFISPYVDSKDFNKNTPEFEKRQVAILHEILSMTLEKKTTFDYLTHFRKEYRLPQTLLALALRHNCIFYVSRKGGRFTIFLKEAYERGCLIEKNEWNIIKDNFLTLMDNRKLKQEDLEKKSKEKVIEDAGNGNKRESTVEEEDSEFEALISLCHKISKSSVNEGECNISDLDGSAGSESEAYGNNLPQSEILYVTQGDKMKHTPSLENHLRRGSLSSDDEASSGHEWDHGVSSGDESNDEPGDTRFSDRQTHQFTVMSKRATYTQDDCAE